MIKHDIGGRLIIPIRAIPDVTGRDIPPDDIAMMLAERAPRWQPKVSLASYHYEQDESYHPILPKAWRVVVWDLITLRKKLELDQEIPDENHPVWREESIKRLLPGAFAWWDEFEILHKRLFPEHITKLLGGRPGDREIDENPPLSPKIHDLINEGFEQLPTYIASTSEKDNQLAEEGLTNSSPEDSNRMEWIKRGLENLFEEKANEKRQTPGRIKQKERTKKRHESWQVEADLLWAMEKHEGKNKSDIARLIVKRKAGDGAAFKTIYQVIQDKRGK